jgi:colanic acid/amylovoran biosynthesis glycosyltransferase
MNVAYILNTYPGSFTFVATEIEHLRRNGLTIVPVSLNAVNESDLLVDADRQERRRTFVVKQRSKVGILRDLLRQVRKRPGATWRAVRLAVGYEPFDLRNTLWRLFYFVEACIVVRHLERERVTHAHAHFGGAPSFVAWFASVLSDDLTWSFTVHGPHDFFEERVNQLAGKVDAAAFTVAIADFTRSQLMRLNDNPDVWPKIKVIRCGVELDAFPFAEREPSPALRILTTARLAAEKGQAVVIDAVALLRERGYDVSLDLVGSGPARDDLERLVAARHLGERVTLHGAQPPTFVADLLRRADVFCLASFAEGLPVSIMEAMSCGVPVVASAINGTPELVVDGVTGHLVIAGRADAVADAIEQIVKDPQASRQRALAARRAVETQHDAAVVGAQLAEALCNAHGTN